MEKAKIGLALGSGGAKGFAHIGVLQVLQENQIPVDLIAGTSIGSVIGACYAAGCDLYMMGKLVEQLQLKDIVDFTLSRKGLVSGKEIYQLIKLLTHGKTFAELDLPLAVCATSLLDGREVIIQDGLVADAVRASIAIPGIFTPMEYEGVPLIDGGVIARTPVRTAKMMGADIVLAVDVAGRLESNRVGNIIEIIMQAMTIMEEEIAKGREREADFIIRPDVADIPLTAMNLADIAVDRGRQAAEEALPDFQRLLERYGS